MDKSLKKPRVSRWFWLVAIVAMFCTSGGCALFEEEPQKPATMEEFIGGRRPGPTKFSMD